MENRLTQRRWHTFAAACFAAGAATLCLALCPSAAFADSELAYSYDDQGNKTSYDNISDAVYDGYKGKEIYMSQDWQLSTTIYIFADRNITINMNGHSIRGTNSNTPIYVQKDANLTLTSSKINAISYKGYAPSSGSKNWVVSDFMIDAGGLITGCTDGIYLDRSSTLTLKNVVIAGNSGSGINAGTKSTIYMKENARIQNNYSSKTGGGIDMPANSKLYMDNSTITQNYGAMRGGGVSTSENCEIDLENNAKITGNASNSGGGIYVGSTGNTLVSEDKTGVVSENTAYSVSAAVLSSSDAQQNGGGIHVSDAGDGDGFKMTGITLSGNYSALNAGGIELNHKNSTITDCTITGNVCNGDGGGVRIHDEGCTIKDSTITGNSCDEAGKNNEGGGVFVSYKYDVGLSGVCVIKGNTRGKNGSADDLFLSSNVGNTARAYIVGGVSTGTKVGVRTGISGDCKIAEGLSNNCYGAFFMDLNDYYVSYEHDNGGKMWQGHRKLQYLAKLNGVGNTRYDQNALITVDGSSKDAGKVFWHWDANASTGLYPVSEFINGRTKYEPILTYSMPQNDTNVKAVYADRVTKANIELAAPVAGKALPTTATFKRADGGDGAAEATAAVTWYEVKANGARVAVSGNAKPGTEYVASIYIKRNYAAGLHFSGDIKAADVTAGAAAATSAIVDSATGSLTVESSSFKTEGEAASEGNGGKVVVNCENGGLQALAGSSKQTQDANDDSLGTVDFCYSESSESITITAPKVNGMNFCNWEDVKDGWVNDDVEGALTIPVDDLADGLEVTAVYTPVIAKLEVGLSTPKAGEKLSTKATSLTAVGSDGEVVDMVDGFGKGSLSAEWTPAGKSAAYSTAYSAIIELGDDEGYEGLGDVLAENAKVTLAGGEQASSAGFAVVDGKLCLCVMTPQTTDVAKVKGLSAKKSGKKAAKVTWKKGDRDGVQIRYSLKKNMKSAKKVAVKGKAVKTKTIKKLKSGKRYYFQVRAYKTVNGQKCYSSWSDKVSVKVK